MIVSIERQERTITYELTVVVDCSSKLKRIPYIT